MELIELRNDIVSLHKIVQNVSKDLNTFKEQYSDSHSRVVRSSIAELDGKLSHMKEVDRRIESKLDQFMRDTTLNIQILHHNINKHHENFEKIADFVNALSSINVKEEIDKAIKEIALDSKTRKILIMKGKEK